MGTLYITSLYRCNVYRIGSERFLGIFNRRHVLRPTRRRGRYLYEKFLTPLKSLSYLLLNVSPFTYLVKVKNRFFFSKLLFIYE